MRLVCKSWKLGKVPVAGSGAGMLLGEVKGAGESGAQG